MPCIASESVPPDASQIEAHRTALMGHCYRMLGSPFDAEDAVQETMVRAWRSLDRFDGRSTLHTWLYRIATNVCLDALQDQSRRMRPLEDGPVGSAQTPAEALIKQPARHWLAPVPDARVIPKHTDPATSLALRQSVRLAFVAALQHLPPSQRAALLLTEVLGWTAAEVAEALASSVASVNSALQRARSRLAERLPQPVAPVPSEHVELVDRFAAAFEAYDVDALAALLTDDAVLSMPPYTLWLQGPQPIADWLRGTGAGCRDSLLIRTMANGTPAFAQYRQAGAQPWALIVLELTGERISALTSYLDTDALFPLFGVPARL